MSASKKLALVYLGIYRQTVQISLFVSISPERSGGDQITNKLTLFSILNHHTIGIYINKHISTYIKYTSKLHISEIRNILFRLIHVPSHYYSQDVTQTVLPQTGIRPPQGIKLHTPR